MKPLNSYRFSFSLDTAQENNSLKARFSKEDFFKGSNKAMARVFKDILASGLMVVKIKGDKVTGHISFEQSRSYSDAQNLITLVISSLPEMRCLAFEDKATGLGEWFFIGRDLKMHAPKGYWPEASDKRQGASCEVSRLISTLKGFYIDECFHSKETPTKAGLVEFHGSKRPYGNKDVAASIAFNLGWDWARVLCWDQEQMPDSLVEQTELLHSRVLSEIEMEAKSA